MTSYGQLCTLVSQKIQEGTLLARQLSNKSNDYGDLVEE